MATILLGITGSVAATKTLILYRMLSEFGHIVRILATDRSLHFFNPKHLNPKENLFIHSENFFTEKDEWEGGGQDNSYQRGDRVLHIDLAHWAEMLLVAPLDANSLSKFALGITEGCLCSVWRAWDWKKPVILAPAMNTTMWEHPATHRHILRIAHDSGLFSDFQCSSNKTIDLIESINSRGKHLVILPPVCKRLACGEEGMGAMAEVETIVQKANQFAFFQLIQ